jgi:hypothetical protein
VCEDCTGPVDDSPEPDWGYLEWVEEGARHREEVHNGGDCDCPDPEPQPDSGVIYSDEPPF